MLYVWLGTFFFFHWLFDFTFQSNWMATNKSKMFTALELHSVIYGLGMAIIALLFSLNIEFFFFALFNFVVSHLIIDGVTSRITSYFWGKERRHAFFTTIGFDQFVHIVVILWMVGVYK